MISGILRLLNIRAAMPSSAVLLYLFQSNLNVKGRNTILAFKISRKPISKLQKVTKIQMLYEFRDSMS